MKFRLLGPMEIVINDEVITIAAPRHEIVLAALLLDANRVVSIDRMIDALWCEAPPRTARRQVQIIISGLRQLLPGADIVTRHPGYLINVADGDLDVTAFEEMVALGTRAAAEGRVTEAIDLLRSGLALWRGEAMDGIASDAIRIAATRLNESRILALQDCLDLEIQNGWHREAIGELTKLVAEHPMNERFRRQLMLALYWAGRQADALDVFRVGREIMKKELGLEPSASLSVLERSILAHDKKIEPPAAASHSASDFSGKTESAIVPHQLPRTITDLTGREEMLAEITQIITGGETSDPSPRIVALAGRHGTGKTELAVHAAHTLSQHFPDGQLFLQLGADRPEDMMSALGQLLQALGAPAETIPDGLAPRAAMYRSWLAGRRVVIVLDGAVSRSQITPFLPGTGGCAAIVTSARRIQGLEGAHQIDVGPLDDDSAARLLATLIGAGRVKAEPKSVLELARLCDGLPLALRIAAGKLALRPHWGIGKLVTRLRDEARRLDELHLDGSGIRETLAAAYESLDPGARLLLKRLSLVGTPDFAPWVSAPLLDQDVSTAENMLQQLVETYMVEGRTAEDGTVRFRLPDLVRIYAIERMADEATATERLEPVRRLLGCWLHLAAAAHRRVYGGDYALLHGAAERRPLPDGVTDELLREPARWFWVEHASLRTAIRRAAQLGMDELCWDLVVTASPFLAVDLSGDWRDLHAVALDAVRRAGGKRGEGALLYSLGMLEASVNIPAATRCFERSLAAFNEVGDPQGRALALTGLASASRLNGSYALSLQYNQEALICFGNTGDLFSEAYTLTTIALSHTDVRDFGAAELAMNEALAVLRMLDPATLGAVRLNAQIQYALAELAFRRGREEMAVDSYEAALRLSRKVSDATIEVNALIGLGTVRCALGDFVGSARALAEAMELADSIGHRLGRGCSLLALAELEARRFDDGRALARIDEAIEEFREFEAKGPWQARALELRVSVARHAWKVATELAEKTDAALAEQFSRILREIGGAELTADPPAPAG